MDSHNLINGDFVHEIKDIKLNENHGKLWYHKHSLIANFQTQLYMMHNYVEILEQF